MYLKALEIQGFKSFPDKTVLNFGEDVTAIVGPNGSGKSNISDAIRWVMGEQSSKSLRGSKMEDVIFGGTEKRSQMGFAQVTLVIDNTEHIFPSMDETEVAVTRRYYRSGESEYYINKQSVRLRDVNELFMDTGMGREGYSIIGQGRIDEILSAKSTDRREIFEEAAGISKFRHRKEETERKLEHTEENLLRINDKIAELELQVEPLRTQAERRRSTSSFATSCAYWRSPSGLTRWKSSKRTRSSWRRTMPPPRRSLTRRTPTLRRSTPQQSSTARRSETTIWRRRRSAPTRRHSTRALPRRSRRSPF